MQTSGYLIFRHQGWASLTPDGLAAALGSAPVRSILLDDVAIRPKLAAELTRAAQFLDIAVLVDDPARVASVGADGVHLPLLADPDAASAALAAARHTLGAKAIVGVEATGSRHNAMLLGEQGADYIAFGGPAGTRCDFVAWWAELFEPPVVAWGVTDAQEVRDAVEAAADFVALTVEAPDELAISLAILQNTLPPVRRT